MDPINNQTNNQPTITQQQPVPQPQQNLVDSTGQQGVGYQSSGSKKGNKAVFILILLLISVIGLALILIFANSNNSSTNVTPPPITQRVISTPTPTPVAEDDFTIPDPEIDIKILDDSAATL